MRRPVLYIRQSDTDYIVFRLTSKFSNKSAAKQKKYIKLTDWQAAGLPKQSWIDTIKIYKLPIATTKLTYIGRLSTNDARHIADIIDPL
ncbi:hypothetical protein [Loigolactobacillus zhaoyuanensis]|uniref:mRNA interferase MazF n=1 Tax=Loigolactobacillus zhaoyuanensis TaxID=2486017 RepID=A0ABW8UG05_9LACO